MFPTIRLPNTTMWEPGPYPGVEFAHLSHDSSNGARFLLRKFAAGTSVPAHRHPQASESVVILKGKWIEGNVEYGPGSFLHAPKNTVHGPHRAEKEVVSVTWYDGPFTVENANTEDPAPSPIPPVH
ncbi:MAG: cupin domain-containing protein [Verrucomicrobia bacterium]|jgi:anti-sigma factor ChrR (cupin superfamily)|nr:cupin domain-containing protein [Verrucomicrobiota bacterium]